MSVLDRLAGRMIRGAARRAPGALRERLEEEWLADFAERRSALSRLRLAIGCYWATNVIAHELAVPALAAPGGTSGKALSAYLPQDFSFLSRRTTVLVLIAGLHVLVFFALTAGMVPNVTFRTPPATTTAYTIPEPPTVAPPATPRLPPKLWQPHYTTPDLPPEVLPPQESDQVDVNTAITPLDPLPPPQPPTLTRVLGGPGSGFPNAEEFYPPGAVRLGETGAATVSVCVNALGQLAREPLVTESSGSVRLDGAALRVARAGSGHYRATTENGRAVDSCFPMRVRFQLR